MEELLGLGKALPDKLWRADTAAKGIGLGMTWFFYCHYFTESRSFLHCVEVRLPGLGQNRVSR